MREHRYDGGIGRPKGVREDTNRCRKAVANFTGYHFYQCRRKRGHGPDGQYCKQHAKRYEGKEKL